MPMAHEFLEDAAFLTRVILPMSRIYERGEGFEERTATSSRANGKGLIRVPSVFDGHTQRFEIQAKGVAEQGGGGLHTE